MSYTDITWLQRAELKREDFFNQLRDKEITTQNHILYFVSGALRLHEFARKVINC